MHFHLKIEDHYCVTTRCRRGCDEFRPKRLQAGENFRIHEGTGMYREQSPHRSPSSEILTLEENSRPDQPCYACGSEAKRGRHVIVMTTTSPSAIEPRVAAATGAEALTTDSSLGSNP